MQVLGIGEAADQVRRFYYRNEDDLPEIVRDKVGPYIGTGSSPVDLVVHFTEAVFANRQSLPADGLALGASCALLIETTGFHNRLDGRAAAMIPALRRDAGEEPAPGTSWPDPAEDPEPKAGFLPVPAGEPAPVAN